ncbi:hypothetical protein [Candidatus Pseudomonas adelgestsugas]|uniref:Lipoprotein n=1 Tax=Candidatus Pseudomonas adelgestsugas TaxID=1302376 RepID=A0ABX5R9L7_9PSED|nr:hypothetical protein [Candidatus Pseudomonas adelgestsugas]QAX81993.1 hypothetical protein C3B55_00668 [Candidatus Pseudomonas adelgestsugas]
MITFIRIIILGLVLWLSSCAIHQPSVPISQTIKWSNHLNQPRTESTHSVTPSPQPQPSSSPIFAPPLSPASHWDSKLQVYVLEEQPDTFYRQRTYYRWRNGWSCSISPNGPWKETNLYGVPQWLSKHYAP